MIDRNNTHGIERKMGDGSIPIVFATDVNYYTYLGVALQSLKQHKSASTRYDIIILENDLSGHHRERLENLSADGISIRVINIKDFAAKYKTDRITTLNHITESAYYRLMIAEILQNYDKIIYLDCDLVAMSDLAELHAVDLSGKYAAVVQDLHVAYLLRGDKKFGQYMDQVLSIKDLSLYFNSGVLVLNLELMRERNIQHRLLEVAAVNYKYFNDQNVLNAVFYNQVVYVDSAYNVNYHLLSEEHLQNLPDTVQKQYMADIAAPKILHFTSSYKPWSHPYMQKADIWWRYARLTPLYEEILYKNIRKSARAEGIGITALRDLQKHIAKALKYYRYSILAALSFGKMRRKYKQKKQWLLEQLKAY